MVLQLTDTITLVKDKTLLDIFNDKQLISMFRKLLKKDVLYICTVTALNKNDDIYFNILINDKKLSTELQDFRIINKEWEFKDRLLISKLVYYIKSTLQTEPEKFEDFDVIFTEIELYNNEKAINTFKKLLTKDLIEILKLSEDEVQKIDFELIMKNTPEVYMFYVIIQNSIEIKDVKKEFLEILYSNYIIPRF